MLDCVNGCATSASPLDGTLLDGCAMHLHMQAGGCAVEESKPVGTTVGGEVHEDTEDQQVERSSGVGRWGAFVGR